MAYSHYDIAHNFAHKTGIKRYGGNMFYDIHADETATIYSYGNHFAIARHVPENIAKDTVLFTEREYSSSTSGHKNIVRGAISHLNVIYVPDPADYYFNEKMKYRHKSTFEKWNNDLSELIKKQVSARTRDYTGEIASIATNAVQYAVLFKCRNLFFGHLRKITRSKCVIANELFSPDQIEKIKAKRKADQERNRKEKLEQITRFKEFKTAYIHSSNYTYLRANGETIETSKGIKIDIEQGRQVFDLWKRAETNNTTYHPDVSISGYRISQISPDYIRAGCHLIPRSEIKEISNKLKWQ